MPTKTCTTCSTGKPVSEFYKKAKGKYGVAAACKECQKQRRRDHLKANAEKINSGRRKQYRRTRRKVLKRNASYHARRYKEDSVFKLRRDISRQLRQALNGYRPYNEGSKVHTVTGLTGSELRDYLHSTFESNYGIPREHIDLSEVQIDHITPISKAETEDDVKRLNHYTNLQLLFKEDNVKKRDSVESKENSNE